MDVIGRGIDTLLLLGVWRCAVAAILCAQRAGLVHTGRCSHVPALHPQTAVQAALHVQEYVLLATNKRHRAVLLRGRYDKATGAHVARLPSIVAFESAFYVTAILLSLVAHTTPCAEAGCVHAACGAGSHCLRPTLGRDCPHVLLCLVVSRRCEPVPAATLATLHQYPWLCVGLAVFGAAHVVPTIVLLSTPVLLARLDKAAARSSSASSVSELVEYIMAAAAQRRDRQCSTNKVRDKARQASYVTHSQGMSFTEPDIDPEDEVWLHHYVLAGICTFDGLEFVVLALLLRLLWRQWLL